SVTIAQLELLRQRSAVPFSTRVIETFPPLKAHIRQPTGAAFKHPDRIHACAVRQHSIVLAQHVRQLSQMNIDFVLKQGRTGGGTAPTDIALFKDNTLVTTDGECVCKQRATDAPSNDCTIAA